VKRVRIGAVPVDVLTFDGALDAVDELVASGRGGTVLTPNVDHVVLADEDARFREAYAKAALSLVDGQPVVWSARLLGTPLPAKISGSDFVRPLLERAAERGWRVYLLGGAEGVAERAKERLGREMPSLVVCGTDAPRIDMSAPKDARADVLARVRRAAPDLVLVCMGAPKQELWATEAAPSCQAWSSPASARRSISSPARSGARRRGSRAPGSNGRTGWRASRGGSGDATSCATRSSS
jgi:N-acetylglucosaminyldiphosphoundecaprenol N-acetyl-beta-D-mannosaminyltransferase